MFPISDLTFIGSFAGNISNPISPAAQALIGQLWSAFIAPLDFRDFIISIVAVSAVILAVILSIEMVRDLKQMNTEKKKKKEKWLGVRRDFPTDAALAEELQFEEALLFSLSTAPSVNEASSSKQKGPISKSFCEICLEEKEKWQMFKNDGCPHSFCSECTSRHIKTRVEENAQEIVCPGVNCRALLKADACRNLVPKKTLVKWDEAVCKSMYVESQKLYCPYRDCSSMLVNDTGEDMKKSKCPLCKRWFCAACRVPWHSEFTCKEFKKLNGQVGKEDAMVMTLAKKKKWQKCPKCKMLVEKSEGCNHMTCRCKYEFCYKCGGKWSSRHEPCSLRS